MSECGQLTGRNCGYCASSNTFSYGDDKGPKTDACKQGEWAMTPEQCKEVKDRNVCSSVASCPELAGESAAKCGFCPTTGVILAKKKSGNKFVPKYKDDTCSYAGGLVIGDQCNSFVNNNPCITPYSNTGPHSQDCLKRLWKNSGCKGEKPYGKTFEQLKADLGNISVGSVSQAFKKLYSDTTPRDDLGKAMIANEHCFNKPRDGLNPCDRKFVGPRLTDETKVAREMCAKQIWREKGGSTTGNVYYDKLKENFESKNKVLAMDKDNYAKNVDQLKRTADKKLANPNEFKAKNNASLALYGKPASAGDGLRGGDYIVMPWPGKTKSYLYGYIIEQNSKTKNWNVLWVIRDINGKKEERKVSMPKDIQRRKFGWNGIKASGQDMKDVGDAQAGFTGENFKVLKRCTPGHSLCGNSCGELIYRLLDQYPRPQDCIVGEWTSYNKCSKECGVGGKKTRTRKILFPNKKGGLPCPTLTNTISCNVGVECLNKNFKKSNTLTIKGTMDKVNFVEIRHEKSIHIEEIEVYNEYGENVALKSKGARASESSSDGSGKVDAPIDGVAHTQEAKEGKWSKGNAPWCHTKSNEIGWWKVKLAGGMHTVARVVVYNRSDCCQDVLKGATLHLLNVSDIDGTENEVEVRTLTDELKQTYNYGDKQELSCLKLDHKGSGGGSFSRDIYVGSVGSGSRYTSRYKTVSLPAGITSVSGKPRNYQHRGWSDSFSATVKGNKVKVKRLDRPHGWGQQLRLRGTGKRPVIPAPPPCTSKEFKINETAEMNKFKSQCRGDRGKIVQGNCISSFFELSPYYSQKTQGGKYWSGGDLDTGYKSTSAKSTEDCAMDCAKNPKCNRFSFGTQRHDGQSGLGCRISDGTYNNGKSPVSSDRYVKERVNNDKWDKNTKGDFKHNYWGGKVYDRKDTAPKTIEKFTTTKNAGKENFETNAMKGRPFTYIGLFKDGKSRDLPKIVGNVNEVNAFADAAKCQGMCKDYKYFGLQYFGECWCGNTYGKHHEKTKQGVKAKFKSTLADKIIPAPTEVKVLSNNHASGTSGKYFNFDVSTLDKVFGSTKKDKVIKANVKRGNSIIHKNVDLQIWSNPNGGSKGNGHGRFHPIAKSRNGQWKLGDIIMPVSEDNEKRRIYRQYKRQCVNGNNIRMIKNKSVEECGKLCDKESRCKGFEYGVGYGGGGYGKPGDCQLQSSSRRRGCNGSYWNFDFYAPTGAFVPKKKAIKAMGTKLSSRSYGENQNYVFKNHSYMKNSDDLKWENCGNYNSNCTLPTNNPKDYVIRFGKGNKWTEFQAKSRNEKCTPKGRKGVENPLGVGDANISSGACQYKKF